MIAKHLLIRMRTPSDLQLSMSTTCQRPRTFLRAMDIDPRRRPGLAWDGSFPEPSWPFVWSQDARGFLSLGCACAFAATRRCRRTGGGRSLAGTTGLRYHLFPEVGFVETCHRAFIQRRLESRGVVRQVARVEQRTIGGAGRGCVAGRPLR